MGMAANAARARKRSEFFMGEGRLLSKWRKYSEEMPYVSKKLSGYLHLVSFAALDGHRLTMSAAMAPARCSSGRSPQTATVSIWAGWSARASTTCERRIIIQDHQPEDSFSNGRPRDGSQTVNPTANPSPLRRKM